jgi:probable rRNA maturation factor
MAHDTEPYVTVSHTARRPWRTGGFGAIAGRILGPTYHLSIVLIGDTKARDLNRRYRDNNTAANVLSFPLGAASGEIYLNVARIAREASSFGLTPEGHATYLLIHGCLHLKGYGHGSTMETAERRFLNEFHVR